MKTTTEPHSVLENAMIDTFRKCKNRKQVRRFIKSLSKKERKFLQGQLEYKQMMRHLSALRDEQDYE